MTLGVLGSYSTLPTQVWTNSHTRRAACHRLLKHPPCASTSLHRQPCPSMLLCPRASLLHCCTLGWPG
jgi:hypothetical protein